MNNCPFPSQVKATLKYGDLMGEGDMVCAAAFDRDDEYFATAGVCKRIKVIFNKNCMDMLFQSTGSFDWFQEKIYWQF